MNRRIAYSLIVSALLLGIGVVCSTLRNHVQALVRPDLIATDAPGIFVDSYRIDVGTIGPDVIGSASIALTNLSDRPMAIEGATSDCGCTVVKAENGNILPNSRKLLKVFVDGNRASGDEVAKRVFVKIKDAAGKPQILTFSIVGKVDRTSRFVSLPQAVDLGAVAPGVEVQAQVVIHGPAAVLRRLPESVILTEEKVQVISLEYRSDENVEPARKVLTLRYRPKGADADHSHLEKTLSLIADGPKHLAINIPVLAQTGDRVGVFPHYLYCPVPDGGEGRTALMLSTPDAQPIVVNSISVGAGIQYRVETLSNGNTQIDFTAAEVSGQKTAELRYVVIALKHPNTTLRIPIVVLPSESSRDKSDQPGKGQ